MIAEIEIIVDDNICILTQYDVPSCEKCKENGNTLRNDMSTTLAERPKLYLVFIWHSVNMARLCDDLFRLIISN